jgi:hypothetical protein
MDLNRTTLIQKVISKGVILTPFEAIHLKYLSRKGILNDLINIEKSSDPYLAAEKTNGPISPYMLDFIVQRTKKSAWEDYHKYNSVYEYLIDQDENSSKRGSMGLMLITQLRLIRAEFSNSLNNKINKPLLDFSSYSYYHQDIKTFSETLKTLGQVFKLFIQDIDDILTLNYFLSKLIDIKDFTCLEFLKKWLSKPKDDQKDFEHMNGAYLCCSPEIIQLILDKNHQNYVYSLERRVGKLPVGFEEESLLYVQNIIKETIKSVNR